MSAWSGIQTSASAQVLDHIQITTSRQYAINFPYVMEKKKFSNCSEIEFFDVGTSDDTKVCFANVTYDVT